MSGRNSAFVALGAAILTAAGVALATPVSVLTVSDGVDEFVGRLGRNESLQYSYRQSIYQVTVFEELARDGTGLRIQRVRSSDIRSVEYFGWKGEPEENDGLWSEESPRTVAVDPELVIRITPAGEQILSTSRWQVVLKPRFGETVVRVRAEDHPWVVALLEGAR
ncbi:MAG TPA: hypothetical protein VNE19_04640 [Methylomirabilota bacterium]|nr:hypothetical protein [Methylomirabilota bacterium]